MKCVFCAEEIQPDAILCRFCGAVKQGDEWQPPELPSDATARAASKGRFTIRTAGYLFVASAIFELFSVTSEVPLFGAVRGGAVAVSYHVLYVAVFLAVGIGLLIAKPWGYWLVFAATALYTLERLLYLLDSSTMEAHLKLEPYRQILEYIDQEALFRMMALITLTGIVCWWGFAAYIYFRRSYFLREP